MIYGHIVLEQQFEKLVSKEPIQIMEEYYQNEMSILNAVIECNNKIAAINEESTALVKHDKFVGGNDYTVRETKKTFIQNMIEKMKEYLKKFIEWCKQLVQTVKKYFFKDSEQIKKEIKNNLNKIKDAKNMTQLKLYSSKIGLVAQGKNSQGEIVQGLFYFDAEDFVEDINNRIKPVLDHIEKGNNTIESCLKHFENNTELSDLKIAEIEAAKSWLKLNFFTKTMFEFKMGPYFRGIGANSAYDKFESLKSMIIAAGEKSIKFIDYIDKQVADSNNFIINLEDRAETQLKYLQTGRDEFNYDQKSITTVSSFVNLITSVGRQMAQERIKLLQKAKKVYARGAKSSTLNAMMGRA